MSENKHSEESFDSWLAANLKVAHTENPAFSQKLLREIETIKAQKLLRKTIFQERIAMISLVLAVASSVGLLCYRPVLMMICPILESGLHVLPHLVVQVPQLNLALFTPVLLVSCLLAKILWDKLSSE